MSGPLGSQQWMYASGFYPYAIDNSLRFNDDDSAYLNKTFASDGNRKTFTLSMWFKLGNIPDSDDFIYYSGTGGSATQSWIYFNSSNSFRLIFGIRVSSTNYQITLDPIYRDPSAWYHLVWSVDTTQATAADRVKIYVNGEQPSINSSSYPPQNSDTSNGAAGSHALAATTAGASFFDGYLSEVNFIDGTALDASSFGETKSGIWIPKAYSGSYGTNGFHLKFAGNANDSSGNGNNWTANNISAHDYVPDSPTNNFAVLNAVDKAGSGVLSEGNLKYATSTSTYDPIRGTTGVSSGKWYWEIYCASQSGASANTFMAGIAKDTSNISAASYYIGSDAGSYSMYFFNGYKYNSGSGSAYGASSTTGDIVSIALDLDAGTLTFYKNGVSQGTAYSGLSGTFAPAYSDAGTSGDTSVVFNFGQDSTFVGNTTAGGNSDANGIGDFKYAPPSGYLALCTSNLPAPAIDPAVDDTPEDYFNTVLWTGNGSTQSITGVGFQPSFIWAKERSSTSGHTLLDTVRGVNLGLESNSTGAELDYPTDAQTSFDADGFSLGSNGRINQSSQTYVAWNWKAGGTAVSNTAGSITSQVSANTKAGFSIVSYTGNGTQDQTIGHGLTAAPEMIIVKNRDEFDSTFDDWWVYHIGTSFPQNRVLRLNESTAELSSTDFWYNSPTSTVFGVNDTGSSGYTNDNTKKYIAYCFHSVEGYSKMGSYVGNGSTDGPFVYTGFRPAWVMIKQIDSVNDWGIFDIKRNTFNSLNNVLYPNLSIAELSFSAGQGIDAISNGFKVRVGTPSLINTTSAPYIYLAFAEQPFKYSNAR